MSTTLEPPKPRTNIREIDVHTFEHHWQDEADAAYLYRLLAAAEPDPKKKDVYSRLADVEDRHVVVWADLLTQHGHPPRKFRPSGRAPPPCRTRTLVRPRFPAADAARGRGARGKGVSRHAPRHPARRPGRCRRRWCSRANQPSTRRRWERSRERVGSRGTKRSRADSSATSYTDSTMD